MEIIDKIYIYMSNLEERRFYQYIAGALGFLLILMIAFMFLYYRSIHQLKAEIARINESREEVQQILEKGQIVKREQREIDAILAKDPDFKIGGYFSDNLLPKLGLSDKKVSLEVTKPGGEGKYQETILTIKFTGMTMKELTQLLQEVELNKRVFTKELEITASQKIPNTIEVMLVVATLEPKPRDEYETTE